MKNIFIRLAHRIAEATGHPAAFILAVLGVIIWAALGPAFQYSENWQLVINTSTTIITFLMVFLIQTTQNRDSAALHLKLNELIRAKEGAHLSLLDIEELDEEEFQAFRKMYEQIALDARDKLDAGESDQGCPETSMDPLRKHLPKRV